MQIRVGSAGRTVSRSRARRGDSEALLRVICSNGKPELRIDQKIRAEWAIFDEITGRCYASAGNRLWVRAEPRGEFRSVRDFTGAIERITPIFSYRGGRYFLATVRDQSTEMLRLRMMRLHENVAPGDFFDTTATLMGHAVQVDDVCIEASERAITFEAEDGHRYTERGAARILERLLPAS